MTDQPQQTAIGSDDPLAYFRRRYSTKRSDKVGLVGLPKETAAFSYPTAPNAGRIESDSARSEHDLSDLSDHRHKESDTKKTSNNKGYPTYPTYPSENDTIDAEGGRQEVIMPKCVVCGTSIPTDRVPGVPIDGRLAHKSCIKLGLPTHRPIYERKVKN